MPSIEFSAIGVIRTPYAASTGVPIQSGTAGEVEGTIEVYAEYADGLRDLAEFEFIWVLYHLDRIAGPQLITRPYLDPEQSHGIFATRAPARPNAIGLSPVRLLGVEGTTLRVAGVDMLDGTPLLDIKPYVPEFDAFSTERIGWYRGRTSRGVVADARFEATSKR
ncbi:MAG: tRNA (N6-threonylcarbamoyladenosine(37)-N6)-methyltransferase TrmO [Acidobacteriota bacterium]|nr:tRNA (N6-threonylcarbamoyladenosine(37)-N6)-methyltransferase TrmO [Acidobacteriota bacterium]